MPLQRPFRGLADHLGVYSGGSLNFDLISAVGVGINPEDFINPIETLFTDATLTAAEQVATHPVVPEGQMWRVRYLGIRALDPTATTQWQPVWSDDGSRFFGLDRGQLFGAPTAANVRTYSGIMFTGQEGFVMFPGERLGHVLLTSVGTTANNVTTVVRFQRIKI